MGYKEVIVKPHNYKGWVNAKAIMIREKFKALGFSDLKAFVTVVLDNSLELSSYDDIQNLQKFWHGRYFMEEFNIELEKVLENLKAE